MESADSSVAASESDLIVGVDVGGTKLALRAETASGGRVVDTVLDAAEWAIAPTARAAAWLAECVRGALPTGARVLALGVGAQGGNTEERCRELAAVLGRHGLPAVVVNDASLLVPAAGGQDGIGVIAGTGAIAVGRSAAGRFLSAGGWGWVLGDEAGGSGIVREAARAALYAHDEAQPDDGLLAALLASFRVPDADALTRTMNDDPTPTNWAPHAPAVFAAAEAGSARAASVVDGAGDHLAELVSRLLRKGAVGRAVVGSGGVLVGQPRLYARFRRAALDAHPRLTVELLREAPVAGAVTLARRLARQRSGDTIPG